MDWRQNFSKHSHRPPKSVSLVPIDKVELQVKVLFQGDKFPSYCVKYNGEYVKCIGRDEKHYMVVALTAAQKEALTKAEHTPQE